MRFAVTAGKRLPITPLPRIEPSRLQDNARVVFGQPCPHTELQEVLEYAGLCSILEERLSAEVPSAIPLYITFSDQMAFGIVCVAKDAGKVCRARIATCVFPHVLVL